MTVDADVLAVARRRMRETRQEIDSINSQISTLITKRTRLEKRSAELRGLVSDLGG